MLSAWNALPLLDRLFDDVMNGTSGTALGSAATQRSFMPTVDVRATPDEVVLVCDVPGIKEENLDVSITGDTLTIKGRRDYEGDAKDRVWLGRTYGAFERSFTLPELVDAEKMTADLAHGVLTIHVPRKPQAKPRRIQIGGGGESKQLTESKE